MANNKVKSMLHSWYRFRGNVAPIVSLWRNEFPARMTEALSRFPYPEVALFFEAEKLGVMSMMLFNRRTLYHNESDLLRQAITSPRYNAFCILQMVKGEICHTCLVHTSEAVPIPDSSYVDMRYGRCSSNPVMRRAKELLTGGVYGADVWKIRDLIRLELSDTELMGWDKLVKNIKAEFAARKRKAKEE